MRYQKVEEGIFLKRPNRFIAHVDINGEEVVCHVKNTGKVPGIISSRYPCFFGKK